MNKKPVIGIMFAMLLIGTLDLVLNVGFTGARERSYIVANSSILSMTMMSSSEPKVYVDPATSIEGVSCNFVIYINVANVTNLYGFDFKLSYNTFTLDGLDVFEGTFLKEYGNTSAIKLEVNDVIGLVWVNITLLPPSAPAYGNGTLAWIRFRAVAEGLSDLILYDTKLADPSGTPIVHDVGQGFLQVIERPPNPWIFMPENGTWVNGTVTVGAFDWDFTNDINFTLFEYSRIGKDWVTIGIDNNGTNPWNGTYTREYTRVWNGTYITEWNTSEVAEGWYRIGATMYDIKGLTGQNISMVYVDPTPPIPSIIQPDKDATVSGEVLIKATIPDEDVTGVVFSIFKTETQSWDVCKRPGIIPVRQPDSNQRNPILCHPTAVAMSLLWLDWKYHDRRGELVPPEIWESLEKLQVPEEQAKVDKVVQGLVNDLARKMSTREYRGTDAEESFKGRKEYFNEYYKRSKDPVKYLSKNVGYPWEDPPDKRWFTFYSNMLPAGDVLVSIRIRLLCAYVEGTTPKHPYPYKFEETHYFEQYIHHTLLGVGVDKSNSRVEFIDPWSAKRIRGVMNERGEISDLEGYDAKSLMKMQGFEACEKCSVTISVTNIVAIMPEKEYEKIKPKSSTQLYGWTTIGEDTDETDGWSVKWDTATVEDGSYLLMATTIDQAGNEATDMIWVDVYNKPVGGYSVPIYVHTQASWTPHIALASTIIAATIAAAIYVKRIKRKEKKQ